MSPLNYRKAGKGAPLVLLHGFCENNRIWDPVVDDLSKEYQLILPDLPGHGETPLENHVNSLEDVADQLLHLFRTLELYKPILMGHSMGGYVTLAAINKRPEYFRKFGLIHSTAMADSSAKKANRDKAIAFIKKHGSDAFFDNFIPGLYHIRGPWADKVDALIRNTSRQTLIRFSAMMRDRPDHLAVLENFKNEILILGGEKDSFIAFSDLEKQAALARRPVCEILPDTGHLSMFEDPERLTGIIKEFCRDST